ncbi:MAG: metallophosphoesterase, partial [Planctomycetaceae bacterium]|nr:metallophosphoesterase [Planctomycetaceae bacterium]
GHTEVQVMLINRVHSQRLQRNVLRHLEQVHQLLILVFPPLLIWFAGFRGPALLTGGDWQSLSPAWQLGFALCGVGFVSQVACAIRWQTHKDPSVLTRGPSRIVDFAEELGEPPRGTGLSGLLARLPGNQVFQVEWTETQFRLPNLPEVWHGLTILHLTDWHIHGTPNRAFFEAVTREVEKQTPDLIFFTGDLMDDLECLDWLPQTLGRLKAPLGKYYILGNHDWLLDPPAIRRMMNDLGWRDVASHTHAIEYQGLPMVIGGTERPWMGQHPDFEATPESAFRVLLSHTPDNFGWAKDQGIDVMLSGHNHGGQIILPIIGPMYTPSFYGVRYSAGCWYEDGTLMYVSRGLSGEQPVRINCRPEITLHTFFSTKTNVENAGTTQQTVATV